MGPGGVGGVGAGIYFLNSSKNLFIKNIIYNNAGINGCGIYINSDSNNNNIFNNYFSNNSDYQAVDNGINNLWDNSYFGNYWGDYTEKYPNAMNIDGIWNISYEISGNAGSEDGFPLVNYSIPVGFITVNATDIIAGQWIQFSAITAGGNPPLNYQWDFGDGSGNAFVPNGGGGGDPPPPCTPDPVCLNICYWALVIGCGAGVALICAAVCVAVCGACVVAWFLCFTANNSDI